MGESPSLNETSEDLSLCQEVVTILLAKADDAKLCHLNNSGNVDKLIAEAVRPFLTKLSKTDMDKALSLYTRDSKSEGPTV
jgi:hypothetical protein